MIRAERALVLAVALAVAAAGAAPAAVCVVPSAGHPTVGSATRDPVCTTIALGVGTFAENVEVERNLVLLGGGASVSVLAGTLRARGATTQLALSSLAVDGTLPGVAGCAVDVVAAEAGAEIVAGPDLEVRATDASAAPCRLLADGFESGSTLAWTLAAP